MVKQSLLLLATIASVAAQNPIQSCIYTVPGGGVTYDLTALTGQARVIQDNRNQTISTWYAYYFGVCNDIDPDFYKSNPQCLNTTGDDGKTYTFGPTSAVQLGIAPNTNGFCKRIGGPAVNGQFFPMGNPQRFRQGLASGVSLFYPNGDLCYDPYNSTNYVPRNFAIDFQCYDSNGFFPINDVIQEDIQCTYHAMIKTPVGCPIQCKRGGPINRICAANGICGYDMTNGYAKCFCNQGYSGADCTAVGDKGLPPPIDYSPNIAGGFFGGLFGGVALAVAVFMVRSKLSGGGLFDGFSFGGFGGGNRGYTAAPSSSSSSTAWSGSSASSVLPGATATGYVAPDPLSNGGSSGMGDIYGQLNSNDGPLIG